MTVRNVREWQALGLLPRPVMRGRVGYYDESLVTRVEQIEALRAEGFTLELVRRILDASGEASPHALTLARALRAPYHDDAPPIADLMTLSATWGVDDLAILERAVRLGLMRVRGDGQLEFASGRVARVGEALLALGLDAEEVLDATAEIRSHADGMADVFARVWLTHVWGPFVDAGMPEDRWPEIRATLDAVQPVALDAVVGMFAVAMEAKVEESIAREIERAQPGSRH